MPEKHAIFTEGLIKKYKGKTNPTLDGLNLKILKGSLYGLLAPNGAGKTTTIDILCGLKRFDSGRVLVDGLSVPAELSEIKKIIGLVPQEIALFPMLTGKENLRIIGGMYGVEGKILNDRVDELLERFGLENSADRPLSQYSGGMKRRINLLAGLLHTPKILILDEPTVGVDAQSRNLILEELIRINREGTTVLFISHYLEEAECICDTVGHIDGGKIVLEGNPAELGKSNPECKNLEALYFKLTGKQMRDTYE